MKGTLHKTQRGWTVKYGSYVNLKSLPLHPDDESVVSQTYINDEYETVYIYVGKDVEFEIVKEYIDKHTNQVQEYAKLTPKTEQTNGERFEEFMKTVEYPELEGTMNLCNDIIEKKTGKMTEEEWQAAEKGLPFKQYSTYEHKETITSSDTPTYGKGELVYKDGTPIRSYYSAKIQDLLDEIEKESVPSYREISDEEIEEASRQINYGGGSMGWIKDAFKKGAAWYREQLKKK